MKILFVLENFYPKIGGVETLFFNLAKQLANNGHSITVLTSGLVKDNITEETIEGIRIVRTKWSSRYAFTFLSVFKATRLAKSADIIHTTSYNAAIPARFASWITSKPCIITFHEYWSDLWFSLPSMGYISAWMHFLFERVIAKLKFAKVVAVSNYTYKALQKAGLPNQRLAMIYNGVDYSEYAPTSEYGDRYLFYGRVGISKGLDLLIDGLAILKAQKCHVELDMIIPNDHSEHNQISQMLKLKGISNMVRIMDQLPYDQLKQKIKSAKAVVIPSYSEGFCFVAVESIALGQRIISSNRGALKEVVSGQFNTMEDFSAESLAEAFSKAEAGKWQNREVKEFHLNDSINDYIRLYKEIIAR